MCIANDNQGDDTASGPIEARQSENPEVTRHEGSSHDQDPANSSESAPTKPNGLKAVKGTAHDEIPNDREAEARCRESENTAVDHDARTDDPDHDLEDHGCEDELEDDDDPLADHDDWREMERSMVSEHDIAESTSRDQEREAVPAVDYEFGIEGEGEMQQLTELRDLVSFYLVLLVCGVHDIAPARLTYDGIDGEYPPGVRGVLKVEDVSPKKRAIEKLAADLRALRLRWLSRRIRRVFSRRRDPGEAASLRLRIEMRDRLNAVLLSDFGLGLDERVRSLASLVEDGIFKSDPSRMEDLYAADPETIRKALALARRIEAFLASFARREI